MLLYLKNDIYDSKYNGQTDNIDFEEVHGAQSIVDKQFPTYGFCASNEFISELSLKMVPRNLDMPLVQVIYLAGLRYLRRIYRL